MFKKMLRYLRDAFLCMFGDIKVYKWPMFMVYCPTTFDIKGKQTRDILNIIDLGYVIQRGYTNYLDGMFIPGKYSHSGIYVGNGKVIHAVAEGVCMIDIIDFVRCDKVRILKPKKYSAMAIKRAFNYLGTQYDFDFEDTDKSLYCHELVVHCYEEANIQKMQPKLLGMTFGVSKKYLSESISENDNFITIYEA